MNFRLIDRFSLLNFGALADVYQESLTLDGENNYPNLSLAEQQMEARQDLYNYLRNIFFNNECSACAILEQEGNIYCAARIEPYRDGMLISALETAPNQRRKGYAKVLLSHIVAYAQQKKIPLYSHIYNENTASAALHISCGFSVSEEYAVFIDGSVSHQAQTYCYNK